MESLSVEIINSKAKTLLRNLAAMNLIHIKNQPTLASMLATLRRNEAQVPSLEEITQEVEPVRQASFIYCSDAGASDSFCKQII